MENKPQTWDVAIDIPADQSGKTGDWPQIITPAKPPRFKVSLEVCEDGDIPLSNTRSASKAT